MFAAASLIAAVALGDVNLGYSLAARGEIRTRSLYADELPASRLFANDLQFNPNMVLALESVPWRTALTYNPSFLFRDPFGRRQSSANHVGLLTIARSTPQNTFLVSQEASYGLQDLNVAVVSPAGLPLPPNVPREVNRLVLTSRSVSSGTIELQLVPQTRLSLHGGYQFGGELREVAPVLPLETWLIPYQWGPFGSVRLGTSVGRVHTLGVQVSGQQAELAPLYLQGDPNPYGGENWNIQTTANWSSRLSRISTLEFDAGLARVYIDELPYFVPPVLPTPADPIGVPGAVINPGPTRDWLPVGGGALTQRLPPVMGGILDLRVGARVSAFTDRFTGRIYQRVEGTGVLTNTLGTKLTAMALGGFGYTLPTAAAGPQGGEVSSYLQVSADYGLDPYWRLFAALQTSWFRPAGPDQRFQIQWTLTTAVTFNDGDIL
jgi:hypothetical protein